MKPQSHSHFQPRNLFNKFNCLVLLGVFLLIVVVLLGVFLVLVPTKVVPSETIDSRFMVKTLPGFPGDLPITLETGYIGVGEANNVQLFYYFVESEGNPENDPLMLMLSGGPGCSGLAKILAETGPLTFDYAHSTSEKPMLEINPYGWTKVSSIIALDQPAGAGFSYAKTSEAYITNDTSSAIHSYQFLKKWLVDHPTFLKNPLYVFGDSYAGLVVPMIVQEIYNGNEVGEWPRINIKGYVIGNGVTDTSDEYNSRISFAHHMALLSDAIYKSTKENCGGEYLNVDENNSLCIRDLQVVDKCIERIKKEHVLEPNCDDTSIIVEGCPANQLKLHEDMEEEPHKIEDAESKSNKSKSKSVKITRVRKPSERIMRRTSFSKFTNEVSDPIILDFDSELSKPILASPCPKKPNKADPTGTIEISDTPANVQYERRLKYKNESQGSRVAENQRRVVNEELEFPKKRSIIDDNTNKDVPPKFRRVQPRRSSSTPEVPVSKPELQKKARRKTNIKPVTKMKNLKQNIPAPIPPQSQSDNILIRTSPKPLFETLHSLSNPQKQYMCEVGLRDLLDITVDGIPSHIGYYAVSNFDCENMYLKVSGGQLPVNRQVVHHLLGLPLGDRNILDSSSNDGGDDTVDKWKEQFKLENDIRPKGVQKLIMRSREADLMFRVNILVLICNTLGQSVSMGTCDLSMLNTVNSSFDLGNIDWCGYIIQCLKNTVPIWKRSSKKPYFFGPITLLTLLYLEGLRFDGVDVEKGRPSICCWNASTMRLREELEMASGPFGMGVIHEIVGREETQEGLITSINDMLIDFEYMRNKIEDKLSVAIGKFPDDPTQPK
ncbi:hypothetical protein L2E82_03751 [Cichorium intybus]|uniref:Uncharacterized protein n=1 Tax=Cichorium intybus TaxID=13427 RepID=A0ACB9H4I1_CICIN|nr:hypothetical protein L2E82_03751 [Cichorium intybus]